MTLRCPSSDSFRDAARHLLRLGGAAALLLSAAHARAQEAEQPAAPEPTPAPEPAPAPAPAPLPEPDVAAEPTDEKHRTKADKKRLDKSGNEKADNEKADNEKADNEKADNEKADKAEKAGKHRVKLKARLFGLAELSHRHETVVGPEATLVERDRDALDLSLQSARIGAEYQSPLPWLAAELELELAGKVRTKDAYVEAGKTLYARVGQFKVPAAELELVSPWKVPLVRRGFVHDLLTDWMDVGGRLPGVQLGYRGKGALKPRFSAGAFQGRTLKGVVPGERDTRLIDHASLQAQTFAARGEVTLGGVAIGAWYEQRVGSSQVGQFRHYATFGLDATTDQRLGPGALRFWLDGLGGQSFYVAGSESVNDPKAWFIGGRALVGYRFGGAEQGEPYLEPFGFFGALDPDADITSDLATEVACGVAGGLWDRARLTLQAETTHAKRNFPTSLLEHQEPDHRSVLLQAGARF